MMGKSRAPLAGRYLGACFLVTLLCVNSCAPTSEAASDKQPIQYNHKIHVQENDMECAECHLYAQSHARATIPNIEVCGDCHSDEPTTDNPEEAKLIGYVMEGRRIPWAKVYRVPSHVYFSHRRHTTLGQIDCVICHGSAEEMTTPFEKPLVSMSMNSCMECHERNGVDNDCTRCHR
jgi:hypothetical protein